MTRPTVRAGAGFDWRWVLAIAATIVSLLALFGVLAATIALVVDVVALVVLIGLLA